MNFMKQIVFCIVWIITILLFFNSYAQDVKTANATLEFEIKALLGEGAIWNHKTQEFYWIDIEGRALNIYNPKTKINRSLQTPSQIGTVVPSEEKDEAIVALVDGIYLINTQNNELELLSDIEADKPENRFNDGKCDPAGRFWVGSMPFNQQQYGANLYMLEEKGQAKLKKDSVTISNGIVWTKDKTIMYYIDTPTAEIKAYDYDDATGHISNERIAVKVNDSLGYPDGMTIDENDNLWVGMWNGNAVIQFDPKTGKVLSKVEVPAHNVTSCAFGGDNLNVLYITTASLDMSAEEQKLFPLAGSIFKVALQVKGVESNFFKHKKTD